jgi:DmsE family decaheme c-type cytochrome
MQRGLMIRLILMSPVSLGSWAVLNGVTVVINSEATPVATPDRSTNGLALYGSQCSVCHGEGGVGTPPWRAKGQPDLSRSEWQQARSDEEIAAVIRDGKGKFMPGFRQQFSAQEILALVKQVRSFMGSAPPVGPARPRIQAQLAPNEIVHRTMIGEKCLLCHKQIVESFALNTHGKGAKALTDSRAAACEACHGNGEEHINTLEAKDIVNPAKLPMAQSDESCLRCHARDHRRDAWQGGKHDRNDMSCLSCHSVHHAKYQERLLARPTVEDTCLSCHIQERKALFQRSTHLFRTENQLMKVNCVSCHNPHGGEGGKMLLASSTNATCYQCHADMRGPFLWEHAPVQENCLTCHSPHGSNNERLLLRHSHQLCQHCHMSVIVRHQAVAGFDLFTFNRGCVNCHSQIHGSNHPSGRQFTR